MEKIIKSLISNWVRGVDTYTNNGSTWLIFTDKKQWVIELTESKTLWYNYNFFKQIFGFVSLDVVYNQHYITKWVEDNIIGGVKEIKYNQSHQEPKFKEVLKNGVKETSLKRGTRPFIVKDTIKNGIKETKTPGKDGDIMSTIEWMEENKSTSYTKMINDVIDNGIKETKHANKYNSIGPIIKEGKINDIIENGVRVSGTFVGGTRQKENVESVIGYGIKNPTD